MRKKQLSVVVFVLFFIAAALVAWTVFGPRQAPLNSSQTVAFIDVGQGDSALIRDGAGYDVLLDGGKPEAGATVVAYLRRQGVGELDAVVASHADSDHIGGLIDVLQANDIRVRQVLYNGYADDTSTWRDFVAAVQAKGVLLVPVQFPQELDWGKLHVHVLNPASGLHDPETNDASLVLLVEYGAMDYLFTGDIDAAIEATVVARGTPVAAEVLKVTHHGSQYGSSAAFLAAVDPQVGVISVGENSYGHPSSATITRLQAAGASVWQTDSSQNILIASDGASYTILPQSGEFSSSGSLPVEPAPTFASTEAFARSGKVVITTIFSKGTGQAQPDEFVEFRNQDDVPIQLADWTLADEANHVVSLPPFVISPYQVCRVYTNQDHADSCGFSYHSEVGIWNNDHDRAYLRDASGELISEYGY